LLLSSVATRVSLFGDEGGEVGGVRNDGCAGGLELGIGLELSI
jgi:hypothetical protein